MNRQRLSRRCIPDSVVVLISLCALLVGAVSAQAAAAASAVGAPGANAVSASVRSVQPAISGLFQVHSPRVWADVIDESGKLGKNNVPDFLDTWEVFRSRSGSANLNGDFYAFLSRDGLSHEILYAGLQRASVGRPGEITFELNQKTGERLLGDLRIVAEIDAEGSIGTARFESYVGEEKSGSKFLSLATLSGEGCNDAGTACIVSNGAIVEAGANLSELLNGSVDGFKGIKIQTPEDSTVGIFSLTPFVGVAGSCVSEVGGHNAGCTANDIQFTAIVPGTLSISNNSCAIDGSGNLTGTVTFSATGRFVLTSQTRYDVGLYIDTNGDPEPAVDNKGTPDAARHGECTRFAFTNAEGVNAEGAGDADGCGDLTQAIAAPPTGRELPFGPVTIECVDKDDDGKVDIFHCETWSQNEDEINCTSSQSVRAGTSSKCNCGLLAGACIATPNENPCLENVCALRCSNNPATACTIGGNQCTAPGFCTDTLLLDQPRANGIACGDQTSGDCKLPDTCQAGVCTTGLKSSTTQCRAANGQCDVAESCTGTSAACPADGFASATTACVGASNGGDCDGTDSCLGSANTCVDGFQSSTTQCRAADGQCDVAESCTGSSGACPANGFASATTACVGTSNGGDCDGTDSCLGSANSCVDGFLAGTTICRAKTGVCDLEESCSGTDGGCPADAVEAGGNSVECRASDGSLCDPAEFCDGTNKDCPGDICLGGTAHP